MSKHTPGPWVVLNMYTGYSYSVVPESHQNRHIGANFVNPESDRNDYARILADIPTERNWPDERLANAHLIAAAPDLLEALGAMLEAYSDTGDDDETVAVFTDKAHIKAVAAIAKARGES